MPIDVKNPGGTPGGFAPFLLGLAMSIIGGYLLLHSVQVTSGYWNWGFVGSAGRSFGLTLIPLLFGIGILFYDGRSFAGRVLTGGGALIILAGIIANMDIHLQQTSLYNVLIMLVLLVGGIGIMMRAVLPMGGKAATEKE